MVKLRVALDFDGVLAQYDGFKGLFHFGPSNDEGVKLANMLHEDGIELICYTCRNNPDMNKQSSIETAAVETAIKGWLFYEELEFIRLYTGPGKPWAHAYVDDRGVYFEKNVGPAHEVYIQIMDLLKGHDDSSVSAEEVEQLGE